MRWTHYATPMQVPYQHKTSNEWQHTLTSDVFGGNDVFHSGESLNDVLGQGPIQLHLAFLQLLARFL